MIKKKRKVFIEDENDNEYVDWLISQELQENLADYQDDISDGQDDNYFFND